LCENAEPITKCQSCEFGRRDRIPGEGKEKRKFRTGFRPHDRTKTPEKCGLIVDVNLRRVKDHRLFLLCGGKKWHWGLLSWDKEYNNDPVYKMAHYLKKD
jgi:hypothetical protein